MCVQVDQPITEYVYLCIESLFSLVFTEPVAIPHSLDRGFSIDSHHHNLERISNM